MVERDYGPLVRWICVWENRVAVVLPANGSSKDRYNRHRGSPSGVEAPLNALVEGVRELPPNLPKIREGIHQSGSPRSKIFVSG